MQCTECELVVLEVGGWIVEVVYVIYVVVCVSVVVWVWCILWFDMCV